MRSTGEVMGIAMNVALAFGKSLAAPASSCPTAGESSSATKDDDKTQACQLARPCAPSASPSWPRRNRDTLERARIPAERVNKVLEARRTSSISSCRRHSPRHQHTQGTKAIADSYSSVANALLANIPYFTTMSAGLASPMRSSLRALQSRAPPWQLQEWHSRHLAPHWNVTSRPQIFSQEDWKAEGDWLLKLESRKRRRSRLTASHGRPQKFSPAVLLPLL